MALAWPLLLKGLGIGRAAELEWPAVALARLLLLKGLGIGSAAELERPVVAAVWSRLLTGVICGSLLLGPPPLKELHSSRNGRVSFSNSP